MHFAISIYNSAIVMLFVEKKFEFVLKITKEFINIAKIFC